MASAAWLTSQVSAAHAATQALGLMEDVSHEAFIQNQGGFGVKAYDVAVSRPALVSRQRGQLSTAKGIDVTFKAVISFVAPVPVDVRDRITLSDGITGQILEPQGGLVDPITGEPFVRVVHLG